MIKIIMLIYVKFVKCGRKVIKMEVTLLQH